MILLTAASPRADGAPDATVWGARRRRAPLLMPAAALLVLAAAVPAAQPVARFSVGDSRERVRQVQGGPDVIERLTSLGVEHWSYGGATVTFDARDGRVAEWSDPARVLRLSFGEASREHGATATLQGGSARNELRLGDSRDDVVRRLGVPWAYTRTRDGRHVLLAYGTSIIRVRADDLRIDGWIARDRALPVSASDTPAASAAMGISTPPRLTASGNRAAPAILRGEARWRDADGDGVVSAGEEVVLTLVVRNEGTGAATAVRPTLVVESPARGGVVASAPAAADIRAGESRSFALSLVAAAPFHASELVVVIGAGEAQGFDLSPSLRLRLPARATGAPRLVLREVRTDDATRDGRIAPREVADVTVRVANDGDAPTLPLRARLVRGEDLFVAAGAPDTFSLGPVAAGASADVSVAVYTNSRAAHVAALLELTDPRGVIVARLPIPLPVTPGGAALIVDVPATATSTGTRRRAPLVHEVERDLPRPATLRPDAIAVIIGIERYRALPEARFAARDAALVRRYATQVLGVPDDDEHVVVRTDAEATGTELRRLFGEDGWLARRVTENTELFVYFAGHGAPDGSGHTPYLLPFDADGAFVGETGFALGALYDRLARLPARSITIALDACFSGQTRGRRALVPGMRPGTLSIEHPALLRPNMAVFAAARDAQAAGDLPDARHGAFTWYLARGLRGEADADADGAITVTELGRFVEHGVSRAAALQNREQRPVTIARDSMRVLTTRRER